MKKAEEVLDENLNANHKRIFISCPFLDFYCLCKLSK